MKFAFIGPSAQHEVLRNIVRCVSARSGHECFSRSTSLAELEEGEIVLFVVNDGPTLNEAKHLAKHRFNGHPAIVFVKHAKDVGFIRQSERVRIFACTIVDEPLVIEHVAQMLCAADTRQLLVA